MREGLTRAREGGGGGGFERRFSFWEKEDGWSALESHTHATHLAQLRDALCGPRAPGEEHHAPAHSGLLTEIRAAVAVDRFDDSVGELLPSLALMRSRRVRTHSQAGVEHQNASLGPRG